jgi:hypothetical protein
MPEPYGAIAGLVCILAGIVLFVFSMINLIKHNVDPTDDLRMFWRRPRGSCDEGHMWTRWKRTDSRIVRRCRRCGWHQGEDR